MTAVAHRPAPASGSPESPVPGGRTRRNLLIDAVEVVVGLGAGATAVALLSPSESGGGEVSGDGAATQRLHDLEAKEKISDDADKEKARIEAALNHDPTNRSNQAKAFRRTDGQVARGTVGVRNNPNLAWRNPIYLGGEWFAGVLYNREQGDGALNLALLVPFRGEIGAPAPSQATIDNSGTGGPVVTAFVEGGILQAGVPVVKA